MKTLRRHYTTDSGNILYLKNDEKSKIMNEFDVIDVKATRHNLIECLGETGIMMRELKSLKISELLKMAENLNFLTKENGNE